VNDSAVTRCPARPPVAIRVTLRSRWASLATWTPNDEQLHCMVQAIARTAAVLDRAIKTAVILTALYLAIEIGSAFLPGGAVGRVLGGLR